MVAVRTDDRYHAERYGGWRMNQRRGTSPTPVIATVGGLIGFLVIATLVVLANLPEKPRPNPTSGWRTYENPTLGFAFKYDPRYEAIASAGTGHDPVVTLSPRVTLGQPVAAGADELTVSVVSRSLVDEMARRAEAGDHSTFLPLTVGGRPAKLSFLQSGAAGSFRTVLVDLGARTLRVTASGQHLETLDAFLGTFQFADDAAFEPGQFTTTNTNRRTNTNVSPSTNGNHNANANVNARTNTNTAPRTNANANSNANTNTLVNVNQNANANTNTATNTNQSSNLNTNTNVLLVPDDGNPAL